MATGALPVGQSGPPLLRVVSPQALTQNLATEDAARAAAARGPDPDASMDELARYIRDQWDMMRNHRNGNSGWSERLLHAQRVFNGKYDAAKLAEIKKFGGSEVYARVIALKCRGASALLREVYLTADKPWGLDPTPEPKLPENIVSDISGLVAMEAQEAQARGVPVDINQLRDRTNTLITAAQRAAKKKATKEALAAEHKLDDLLVEGGFYEALTEFLTDLPLFPFACIKGPVVRIVPDVVWENGVATTVNRPRMFWQRVSPFDVYWTPGVSSIRDAAVIERLRLTRADLNDLIDLPGYNTENIRTVLREYGAGGLHDWMDPTDSQRAEGENRENPAMNRSGMIDCIEFHGNIQGKLLLEHGHSPKQVPDPDRDYFVQAWLIGRYIIKVQITPNPRKRHPYYITSFEKVPGTPVGNALPDILEDIQDVCNATLRSLVNNLSIASGPQVVVDEDRLSPMEAQDLQLYPWKRWRVKTDMMSTTSAANPPISFFSPQSHAQELLAVYKEFTVIADELSAIPRYMSGSGNNGSGAGRTASGLAMLMGNASKILQMVASNIDHDIFEPCLQGLYDMVMLTDQSGLFRGDESIRVRGVEVAIQRETARQRQIEFMMSTANPIDMQIMGLPGRAKVLRAVSETVGIKDEIVPSEEDLMAAMGGQGGPPGMPGVPQPDPNAPPSAQPPGGTPPTPANMALGVPDAKAMRSMV